MNREIHPAALLFPQMSDPELDDLANDIKEHGLLEPIAVFQGKILDGRNRLIACSRTHVQAAFVNVDSIVSSPVVYVLSKNLHRRQLTQSQRAAIAAEAVPMLAEEAKKRQGARTDLVATLGPDGHNVEKGRVNVIAAKAVGVGTRTVTRAVRVMKEAPEEFQKIKRGEITAGAAHDALPSAVKPKKASPPFVASTKLQKQSALSQKRQMVQALSEMTGICRALQSMKIRKIVSVLDKEELETWVEKSKELSKVLILFSRSLEEAYVKTDQ